MIIHGNYVGSPVAQPNWNQTDATKPDYIRGREELLQSVQNAQKAGDDAQTAAENAQTAAENAQTAAENAEKNAKDYAEIYADGLHKIFTVNVPASGWSASAPHTQTVSVSGILVTDTPHYSVVYSNNTVTALAEKEAFSMIDDLDTANGSVKFTCFEEKPEVDLTIQLEVNR